MAREPFQSAFMDGTPPRAGVRFQSHDLKGFSTRARLELEIARAVFLRFYDISRETTVRTLFFTTLRGAVSERIGNASGVGARYRTREMVSDSSCRFHF